MGSNLTLVTTCKNRESQLLHSIKTWINTPLVEKIVVVDFDSKFSTRDVLISNNLLDDKILVLRVDNQPVWKIGLAQNIGIGFVNTDFILKIDSDISIISLERSFDLFNRGNCYIRGKHSLGTSSGMVLMNTYDYKRSGGYNDWITGWGGDDSDFYRRLSALGIGSKYFPTDDFFETKQEFLTKNSNAKILDTVIYSNSSDLSVDPNFIALRNYILCRLTSHLTHLKPKIVYHNNGLNGINVSFVDLEAKENLIRPYIEIANALAISFYSNGYDADSIHNNKLIDKMFDVLCG